MTIKHALDRYGPEPLPWQLDLESGIAAQAQQIRARREEIERKQKELKAARYEAENERMRRLTEMAQYLCATTRHLGSIYQARALGFGVGYQFEPMLDIDSKMTGWHFLVGNEVIGGPWTIGAVRLTWSPAGYAIDGTLVGPTPEDLLEPLARRIADLVAAQMTRRAGL